MSVEEYRLPAYAFGETPKDDRLVVVDGTLSEAVLDSYAMSAATSDREISALPGGGVGRPTTPQQYLRQVREGYGDLADGLPLTRYGEELLGPGTEE